MRRIEIQASSALKGAFSRFKGEQVLKAGIPENHLFLLTNPRTSDTAMEDLIRLFKNFG